MIKTKSNQNEKVKKIKITFFKKEAINCPICKQAFFEEELLTGRGRLIAGSITNELRQIYVPTQKYGTISPLIYFIITCPRCLFSAFPEDFMVSFSRENLLKIKAHTNDRLKLKNLLFPNISFHNENRQIMHGILSYILATSVYSFFEKKYAPSLKRGIASLRAAWLYDDLYVSKNLKAYSVCRDIFYEKASSFYNQAVLFAQNGQELFENLKSYGPDLDNNFGYPGMLYMASLLKIQFLKKEPDLEKKLNILDDAKKIISKIFGSGSSSKEKPSLFLNFSKELFDKIKEQKKSLEEMILE